MEHERLANVPHLCESCYGPILRAPYCIVLVWPGACGLPVYTHFGACHDAACELMKATAKKRRR